MKKALAIAAAASALVAFKTLPQHLKAATPDELLYQGFRDVEVASVSDAMKLLYGKKMYMSHDMRPLFTTKFAGPATTVLLQKEEHTEGSKALAGMMDAIDEAPAGAVYVMVLQDGLDYAGWGGLMSTALKYRGMAGAIVGWRHKRYAADYQAAISGVQPGHCAFDDGESFPSERKEPSRDLRRRGCSCHGYIIVADMDGVVVVPREHAAEVLKKGAAVG